MKLDRDLQKRILNDLAMAYPNSALETDTLEKWHANEDFVIANLAYLNSHGLIEFGHARSLSGSWLVHSVTATAKGMDFLADDGGLSAILGTITVKLHSDTIQDLLAAKIASTDLPEEEKSNLIKAVRGLPAIAVEKLAEKLIDLGIENTTPLLAMLGTYLKTKTIG